MRAGEQVEALRLASRRMLAALLACPGAALQETAAPIPPSPFDRVIELELAAEDPPLAGRGPAQAIDYEVGFSGTLHVWTLSELDLFLRVEEGDWKVLGEDDDSGGGKTPYLAIPAAPGVPLVITVAGSRPGIVGPLELCLIAAPEDEATRAAAARAREALGEAGDLAARGELEQARTRVAHAVGELLAAEGGAYSLDVERCLNQLGNLADRLEDQSTSRLAWGRVRDQRERTLPADHSQLLLAGLNLAAALHDLGELRAARALFEGVVAGFERTVPDDHRHLQIARSNLAVTMKDTGDLSGARAIEERVLALRESTLPEDHPEVLRAQLLLAGTISRMGDQLGARVLYERSLAGFERMLSEDDRELLALKLSLAVVLHNLGELSAARALEEHVLEVRERTLPEDHSDLLLARMNLAATLARMRDLPAAAALLARTVAGYERTRPPDHPEILSARQSLAATKSEMGDLSGARALEELVLAARERALPEHHPALIASRGNLALTLHALGDLEGASELLSEVVAGLLERAMSTIWLSPREAREALFSDAFRFTQVLNLDEAADPALRARVFELIETRRLVAGEAARAAALVEVDLELAPLAAEAAAKKAELNDLVSGSARADSAAADLGERIARLSLERDRSERALRRELASRGLSAEPVALPAIAAELPEGSAAVGLLRYERWHPSPETGRLVAGADHVLAHVVSTDGALTRVELGRADELEELVQAWRAEVGAPILRGMGVEDARQSADGERRAGVALRERLLDPLLAATRTDPRRLYVCADDVVHLVPLDALPLGDGRVGERVEIVNLASMAGLGARPGRAHEQATLLAIGSPSFDSEGRSVPHLAHPAAPVEDTLRSGNPERFVPILQTRFELESVEDIFQRAFASEARVLTGDEATKAALFEQAGSARYLHLATHGWFAPESVKSILDQEPGAELARMSLEEAVTGFAPMTLCGLALAGANLGRDSLGRVPGILTAEELCSLDLSNCELAVLSACETNVGIRRAGQGIQSLQAALFAAGARTSITSLWKVDDAATRKLMELFYTYLWIEKLPKAEALWRAKTDLRSAGHPVRDWAGWVLTGDPM